MHIHAHGVGANHLAVFRSDFQFHRAGEVDAVGGFAGVFHLFVLHPLAVFHLKHRLAYRCREIDRNGEVRHICAFWQRVGVIDKILFLVDGKIHRIKVVEHLFVAS